MRIALYRHVDLQEGSPPGWLEIVEALALQGHEVHVISPTLGAAELARVERVVAWDGEAYSKVKASKEVEDVFGRLVFHVFDPGCPQNSRLEILREVVLDTHPDILHTSSDSKDLDVVRDVSLSTQCPYVIQIVEERSVDRLAFMQARAWLATDVEERDEVLDLFPEDRAELGASVAIVGNGVDASPYRHVPRRERAALLNRVSALGPFTGRSEERRAELKLRVQAADSSVLSRRPSPSDRFPDQSLASEIERIQESDRLIVFASRIDAESGAASALAAFPRILAAHPQARLVFAGRGEERESLEAILYALERRDAEQLQWILETRGHLWDEVRREFGNETRLNQAFELGPLLSERVHFFGPIEGELASLIFPSADLFVLPYHGNGKPEELLRSLACGVPPLVPSVRATSSILQEIERYLGRHVKERLELPIAPKARIDGLVDLACRALEDPNTESLGYDLRMLAIERFEWQHRADLLAEVYRTPSRITASMVAV